MVRRLIVGGLGLLALSEVATAAEPRVTVTVTVVEEQGAPVAGAEVTVTYQQAGGTEAERAITDTQGRVRVTGRTFYDVTIAVRKAGYYESWLKRLEPYEVKDGQRVFADQVLTIGLRPIKNPIPMYARFRHETRIPVAKKPVGFDLIEGDWVAPYGKGRTTDFTFTITGYFRAVYDFDSTLTLDFPNTGDGLVPFEGHPTSDFISPYEAPEAGYQPTKRWRESRTPKPGPPAAPGVPAVATVDEVSDRHKYVFRVRTIRNPDGTIRSALYGKLYGDPRFAAPREGGSFLVLTYYLNPTPNDRNLEYDRERNLATGFKVGERPTQP